MRIIIENGSRNTLRITVEEGHVYPSQTLAPATVTHHDRAVHVYQRVMADRFDGVFVNRAFEDKVKQ